MAIEEVVSQVLRDEHGNVIRGGLVAGEQQSPVAPQLAGSPWARMMAAQCRRPATTCRLATFVKLAVSRARTRVA